jgi:hypothetical protein
MTQITTVSAPPNTTGNYYFLKGRFKSSAINLYGIFLVVFNPQKMMETHNAVVSTFSNLFDFEPHLEWTVFEDKITEFRWKGNCNTNMTSAIINIFETINKDPRLRDEMYGMISSYNYSQMEVTLFDHFNRIIRDKNAILETSIQEASLEEVTKIRESRTKTHEDKTQKPEAAPAYDFEVEEGSTVIPTSLVLSPVRGKLLYELKIGDKIMLRFNPKSEIGNFYNEYFNLKTPEGKIKAVPGEVIDIKSDAKTLPVNILTRIDERIYGVATEEERHVRVCTYDPKVDGIFKMPGKKIAAPPTTARAATPTPEKKYSSMTYFLLGFIAFVLMLLLFLIYIVL